MYVKLCRYRVQPGMMDRFLAIQEEAGRIYQLYDFEPASYFQSRQDPQTWVEIHRFADEEACRAASLRTQRDPKILALWQAFAVTLDPQVPTVVEEFDERVWLGGEAVSHYGHSNGQG